MPATLDLVGDDFGVYRDDEYVLRITVEGIDDITDIDFTAHVRRERLAAGVTATDPLAEFDIDTDEAGDGVITLSLSREQTAGLPSVCVWDLQADDVTWLSGQVSALGDVTREVAS